MHPLRQPVRLLRGSLHTIRIPAPTPLFDRVSLSLVKVGYLIGDHRVPRYHASASTTILQSLEPEMITRSDDLYEITAYRMN